MADPITDTRRLITLLDAIESSPVAVNIDMHDGSIIKTLKAWASTRGITVEQSELDVSECGFIVDRFTLRIGKSRVVVFDMANRREMAKPDVDGEQMWRPYEAVAS